MHQAQCTGHVRIGKLVVEMCDLRCEQQPFVNDRARGKRRNIEEFLLFHVRLGDEPLSPLAHDVELALERVLIHAATAPDEDLLDIWLGGTCQAPDHVSIDWRVAPADDAEAFFFRALFEYALAQNSFLGIDRQKHHPNAVLPGCGQRKAQLRAFALEKRMGNLDQYSCAIAGVRVATARAAMRQVDQDLDALQHDVVRLVTFNVRDKPDPARVMLVPRRVEPLSLRQAPEGVRHFLAPHIRFWISVHFDLKNRPTIPPLPGLTCRRTPLESLRRIPKPRKDNLNSCILYTVTVHPVSISILD